MRSAILISAAAALVAACAPTAGPDGPASSASQCFFADEANGFNPIDRRTIEVSVGTNETWELEVAGPCPDVDWSTQIGLVSRGTNRICDGFDAELVVPDTLSGGTRRCFVSDVRRLSDDEVAARRAARAAD